MVVVSILILPILAAILGFCLSSILQAKSRQLDERVLTAVLLTERIREASRANYTRTLRACLNPSAASLATMTGTSKDIGELFEQYGKSPLTPSAQLLFEQWKVERAKYLAARRHVIDLINHQGALGPDLVLSIVDPANVAYDDAGRKVVEDNMLTGQALARDISRSASHMSIVFLIASLLAVVVTIIAASGILAVIKTLEHTSTRLSEDSVGLVTESNRVLVNSQSVMQGAQKQFTLLQLASTTLQEVGGKIDDNARNAVKAQDLSMQCKSAALEGEIRSEEMLEVIEAIKLASQEMHQVIEGLKSSSRDVSSVINTINEIAFQTNILALNASVEASRAGLSGKAFAVVADEVRTLAQRSTEAARETAQLVAASIKHSSRSVEVSERVSATIQEVTERSLRVSSSLKDNLGRAREVETLVAKIAEDSTLQSQEIAQVTVVMADIDRITQASVDESRQTTAAVEKMHRNNDELRDLAMKIHNLIN